MKIKGLWLRGGVYWFRLMRNGRRHTWSLETNDLATAIQRSAEKLREINQVPADLLSKELECAICAKLESGTIRPRTAKNMRTRITQFVNHMGDVGLASVTKAQVDDWLQSLRKAGHAEAGVQNYARTIKSLFSWHVKESKLIKENPFSSKMPRLKKSPRREFCSRDLRDQLINAAPDDDLKMILYLGFHCGLRRNEIVEARTDWIDLREGLLHVRKTPTFDVKDGEDRTIPLSSVFQSWLGGLKLPEPFLVRPEVEHGKSDYRYDFRLPLSKLTKANGCPWVTSHVMRRTFASLLVSSGVSIYKIAKWLGDGVEVVQEHYGHLIAYDSDINRM